MEKKLFVVFTSLLLFCGGVFAQKKMEYTIRVNVMLGDCSANATAGALLSENVVLGVGAGWGHAFHRYNSEWYDIGQRFTLYSYNRFYIPLGNKRKVFLYSDQIFGSTLVYNPRSYNSNRDLYSLMASDLQWYFSWQPGIAFRYWEECNAFLGLSVGPTLGFHVGLTF